MPTSCELKISSLFVNLCFIKYKKMSSFSLPSDTDEESNTTPSTRSTQSSVNFEGVALHNNVYRSTLYRCLT